MKQVWLASSVMSMSLYRTALQAILMCMLPTWMFRPTPQGEVIERLTFLYMVSLMFSVVAVIFWFKCRLGGESQEHTFYINMVRYIKISCHGNLSTYTCYKVV